jgi:hypothetical protein
VIYRKGPEDLVAGPVFCHCAQGYQTDNEEHSRQHCNQPMSVPGIGLMPRGMDWDHMVSYSHLIFEDVVNGDEESKRNPLPVLGEGRQYPIRHLAGKGWRYCGHECPHGALWGHFERLNPRSRFVSLARRDDVA